ncbi:MAG: hypothetical protein KGI51_11175 [Rhodospirillales bacterium]|nr:hypothetical protein [Rhodospirillales bacterium]
MASAPSDAEVPCLAPVRFFIDADADPGLLPRLLIPFARRDLTPDRMWSHRNGSVMHVEIAFAAAPADEIARAEGNLRQIVGIHRIHRVIPG